MKKIISAVALAFFILGIPAVSNAQGLGGLLNKVQKTVNKGKEILDKTTKNTNTTATDKATDNQLSAGSSVNLANGIEIYNPISNFTEVEPIGIYAISKSENYGDGYLVLRVTQKIPASSILLGSSIENQKMLAADSKGTIYNIDASGATRYDVVEGLPVVIQMSEKPMMFMDLKKGLEKMNIVKVGLSIDAGHKGNLTFKNVPVYWDQDPEL